MPELPEVETVRRSLLPHIKERVVHNVDILFPGAIQGEANQFVQHITGQTFADIERYGKYLAFRFQSGAYLKMHLRMTGRAVYVPASQQLEKHARVRFVLDNGHELRFIDIRKFGRLAFAPKRQHLLSMFTLGPEPLTKAFTVEALQHALRGSATVKSVLLDQRRMAGLGNIYVDEALFRARIHPTRRVNTLTKKEIQRLHQAIEQALAEALEHGGTTIRNYVQGDGRPGEFADHLRVYGRFDEPCVTCGTTIQRIRVAGRGTSFCPQCQQ